MVLITNMFCIIPSVCQDLSVALYKHLLHEDSSGREVYLLGFDLDQDLILRAQNSNPFPQNLQFIPLDITDDAKSRAVLQSYLGRFGCPRFHLCTCFAVTMWVHLNHGDAAFRSLLSRLASLSEYLLLEAQPWKCYRSAARRLRKLGRSDFDHFKTLEIRGDMTAHATEHLEKQCSMELVQSFGNTAWDRSLLLFKRRWLGAKQSWSVYSCGLVDCNPYLVDCISIYQPQEGASDVCFAIFIWRVF